MINVLKMIGGILLIVLALVLMVALIVPAFIWKVVVSITQEDRKARDIVEGSKDFFVGIAASFDQTGCVAYGGFFNWLFLKPGATYLFGNYYETISFVLGWNEREGQLSKTGELMVKILDWLDKDHCKKTLENVIKRSQERLDKYENL